MLRDFGVADIGGGIWLFLLSTCCLSTDPEPPRVDRSRRGLLWPGRKEPGEGQLHRSPGASVWRGCGRGHGKNITLLVAVLLLMPVAAGLGLAAVFEDLPAVAAAVTGCGSGGDRRGESWHGSEVFGSCSPPADQHGPEVWAAGCWPPFRPLGRLRRRAGLSRGYER